MSYEPSINDCETNFTLAPIAVVLNGFQDALRAEAR